MAMSDCSSYWETPCVCGNEYKEWNLKSKIGLLSAVVGVSEGECIVDNTVIDRLKLALTNKHIEIKE